MHLTRLVTLGPMVYGRIKCIRAWVALITLGTVLGAIAIVG
jgi:hypothetical protein